jgi:hypothetical protein
VEAAVSEDQKQALDALRRAALAAFAVDVPWTQALNVLAEARRATEQITRAAIPKRQLKGCPSEAAYRRHLKAREKCQLCRDFTHRVEQERRARHPEWWVHGAGVPVGAKTAWPELSRGDAR